MGEKEIPPKSVKRATRGELEERILKLEIAMAQIKKKINKWIEENDAQ
jgi:hypothetical protein